MQKLIFRNNSLLMFKLILGFFCFSPDVILSERIGTFILATVQGMPKYWVAPPHPQD